MNVVNLLLVSPNGNLLMQHRDDKPGIRNPNMITGFGGLVNEGETLTQAAVRELEEETGLKAKEADFEFFKTYQKTLAVHGDDDTVHVFVLKNVDEKALHLYEGQGVCVVQPDQDLGKINFSPLAKQVVEDFFDG